MIEMQTNEIDNLTPRQLADRCKRMMRATATRPRRSLAAVCQERGWKYRLVHGKLERAGLIRDVMGVKYE